MADLSSTTAVILAGGLGTRLRTVVAEKPKALAPILGRPFLAFLFDRLIDAGLNRAVICTGHMADQIRDEFKSQYRSLKVEYSQETQPLGTAGAIKLAEPLIGNSIALVLNGDSVCDVDFRAFAAFHTAKKCPASMVLVEVPDASRFGRVDIAGDDALLAYHEKSPEVRPGLINSGIYLLEPNFVESIPAGRSVSIERDIFPQWIGKGLYGFRCHGRFIDIGTPESYRQAEAFFGGKS
jgi:D-glycero-alpha-D-manno-heptose 1-phosphate guanylyltransferase